MFGDTADEVIGHADVKRAPNAAGKDVDVEAACRHLASLEYWVAWSSRAMTVWRVAPSYLPDEKIHSPACSLRGRGNSSGAADLTSRGGSTGVSVLLKSSSSMRPARFSILSAEIRICRMSSLASA